MLTENGKLIHSFFLPEYLQEYLSSKLETVHQIFLAEIIYAEIITTL